MALIRCLGRDLWREGSSAVAECHLSIILRGRTFSSFPHLGRTGAGQSVGCVMTGHTQLAITPRDRFLEAAQRELAAVEQREREFSKKNRKERLLRCSYPSRTAD